MQAGRIGPNAILQLADVLERRGEGELLSAVLAEAGVERPPRDAGMLPEGDCAAVHQALRRLSPRAEAVLEEAGRATGDYILTHRIPQLAQGALRGLPGFLAAPVLTRAIARHSWTFAGTGAFRVEGGRPLVLSVARNPLVAGWRAEVPQCIWHVAVFRRLYGRLVWPEVRVTEVACCACGDAACRFEIAAA
ncbi:bacteriochlorophyll 4-vinyl reductase [Rhodobacter calidifons]|uniref:Bacteriochlorophyll 4-vinyl reductase n=1 Tax=Rhodobacter calidifons TaxID=2715277 RepID=A0ABX0G7P7_9RHOB|nr:bacteriochlorophyll 4-vinyl reductase [Rhodobacter calidifons]NHB76972.1 bacteriochlorophyll 4-vinyl reductase [Rhodobacter calidifons]